MNDDFLFQLHSSFIVNKLCTQHECMHTILMSVNLMTANIKWLSTKQWAEQTRMLHGTIVLYFVLYVLYIGFVCFYLVFSSSFVSMLKKNNGQWQIMWIRNRMKNTHNTHTTQIILAWILVSPIFSHHLDNDKCL